MHVTRVFLSSTFLDFAWERDIINRRLVAEVNHQLSRLSAAIDLIDLRWGVTEESSLDHTTVSICLGEIQRCYEDGRIPAFVLLQGERAGWSPLPTTLANTEFEALDRALANSDVEASRELKRWYILDYNYIKPTLRLRPRWRMAEATGEWQSIEEVIKRGVSAATPVLPAELTRKFLTPITEMEIESALQFESELPGRMFALRRYQDLTLPKVIEVPRPAENDIDQRWREIQHRLKGRATTLVCTFDAANTPDLGYQSAFCKWFIETLTRAVEGDVSTQEKARGTTKLGLARNTTATVQRPIESSILNWVSQSKRDVRLLFGVSGSGKTSIVERVSAGNETAPEARPRQVVWFLGRAAERLDTIGFLSTLGRILISDTDSGRIRKEHSEAEATAEIQSVLRSADDPGLFLCVDALERINWRDPSEALSWLPEELTGKARILLTTSSAAIRDVFADMFGPDHVWEVSEMSDAETTSQIEADLARSGRRLQPNQMKAFVENTLGVRGRALVNRVAGRIALRLDSDSKPSVLAPTLDGWMCALLEYVTENLHYGRLLVDSLLSLVCVARAGVPERVLFDLAKSDRQNQTWVDQAFPHAPTEGVFPRTVFSRLMADLDGVLEFEQMRGELYVRFPHILLRDGLLAIFSPDVIQAARTATSDYAAGAWRQSQVNQGAPMDWALAEAFYQLIHLGEARRAELESLATDPHFLTAKSDERHLPYTLEEAALLQARGFFGSAILEEYGHLLRRHRVSLASLREPDQRRDLLVQVARTLAKSSPLRKSVLARLEPRRARSTVRAGFPVPELRGLTRLKNGAKPYSRTVVFDDEIAIDRRDGSIAIVDAQFGVERRLLRGHEGGVADAIKLPGGRLLTCGAEGQVAISSIKAGRDILRTPRAGASLGFVRPLPAGGFVAVSGEAGKIFRWDAQGRPNGTIDVRATEGESDYQLDEVAGLKPTDFGIKRQFCLPTDRVFSQLLPSSGSDLVVIDDDRVATIGMSGLAIWSFEASTALVFINQLFNQEESPLYVVPTSSHEVLVLTNGGSIYRLNYLDRRAELVQPKGLRPPNSTRGSYGGATLLSEEILFAWSLTHDDWVEGRLLDRQSGRSIRRVRLRLDHSAGVEFFRGALSNVRRGLILSNNDLFAWSALGCEHIDVSTGEIKQLRRWGNDEYTTWAVPANEREAILIQDSRPTLIDMRTGELQADYGHWLPAVESVHVLEQGKLLVIQSGGRNWFWDVGVSSRWARSGGGYQELTATPQDVADARVLPGGDIVVRRNLRGDTGREFELWHIEADAATFQGHAKFHGFGGEVSSKTGSGLGRLGPFVLTWGLDSRIRVSGDSLDQVYDCLIPRVSGILDCLDVSKHCALGSERLQSIEPVLLCTTPEGMWLIRPFEDLVLPLQVPSEDVEVRAKQFFQINDDLFLWTESTLFQVDLRHLNPGAANFTRLFCAHDITLSETENAGVLLARSDPSGGLTVAIAVTNKPVGKVAYLEQPDSHEVRHGVTIVVLDRRRNLSSAVTLPDTERLIDGEEDLFVEFTGGELVRLRFDEVHSRFEIDPVHGSDDMIWLKPDRRGLPTQVRSFDGRIHRKLFNERTGASIRLAQRPASGPRFGMRLGLNETDTTIISYTPDRIDFQFSGAFTTWYAPDGYTLLDLDPHNLRLLLNTGAGAFQVLDLDPEDATARPDASRFSFRNSPEINRLLEAAFFERRLGRPELAERRVAPLLAAVQKSSEIMAPEVAASILIEAAEVAVARVQIDVALRLVVQLQDFLQRSAAELPHAQSRNLAELFSRVRLKAQIVGAPDRAAIETIIRGIPTEETSGSRLKKGLLLAGIELVRMNAPWHNRLSDLHSLLSMPSDRNLETPALDHESVGLINRLGFLLTACTSSVSSVDLSEIDWASIIGEAHVRALADAMTGDPNACFELGLAFDEGKHLKRRPQHAVHWYEKAVELGHVKAPFNLARFYRQGDGVPKNAEMAFKYTKIGAERGDTWAKSNLGVSLMTGNGCEQDYIAARIWLQQAHEEGDELASLNLAVMTAFGLGEPTDAARARRLAAPLAKLGNPEALRLMQELRKFEEFQQTERGVAQPVRSLSIPTPHPAANPEEAAAANIRYRRELELWRALPWWKRICTRKPDPPPGVLG